MYTLYIHYQENDHDKVKLDCFSLIVIGIISANYSIESIILR